MKFFRAEILLFFALTFSWVHGQDVQCAHVTLSDNSGTFTSPNYPNEYDHKLSCSWTISTSLNNFIRLTFVEFDMKSPFLKCAHDFVTVDNGTGIVQTYCNNHRPPHDVIVSEGDVMTVTLKTDDFFRNGKGFKASYKIVDKDGNPLDKEEGDDEVEDETGKAVAALTTTTLAKPVTTTMAPKAEQNVTKPRKSKKGKKGKKNRKSKEERRRERKLRRQREKAEKRKNRKSRKGKGRKRGKKAKRGAVISQSA